MRKTYKRWTEEEKAYVQKHYGGTKSYVIAEQLNRPESSVSAIAGRLGLEKLSPHTRALWTGEEEAILKDSYPFKLRRIVQKLLPRHTWSGIFSKARKFKLWRTRQAVKQTFISEELKNIPDVAAAYLAGLVDGEGHVSFTLGKKKFYICPVLGIANTDKRIIAFIEKWLPVLTYCEVPKRKKQKIRSRRPLWRVSVGGLVVGKILRKIVPFMTAKKKRAERVIEFCELAMKKEWKTKYSERQMQLFLAVRKANSRLGKRWRQSEEYQILKRYLISRQALGIS